MPGKKMRLMLTLLASMGIPYVWFNEGWSEWFKRSTATSLYASARGAAATPVLLPPVTAVEPAAPTIPATAEPSAPLPPSGTPAAPINSLADIFRFDVSPDWVAQRWPRVSTVVAQQDLSGLRVPLMSGTELDDLAGSLTYYFDRTDRVQRISFQGHTGDARKLVTLVTSAFAMHPEPALGGETYVARWNAMPTSALRVSYAPVVRQDRPHNRLHVLLEINRPDRHYGLSEEFQHLLLYDRSTSRW